MELALEEHPICINGDGRKQNSSKILGHNEAVEWMLECLLGHLIVGGQCFLYTWRKNSLSPR